MSLHNPDPRSGFASPPDPATPVIDPVPSQPPPDRDAPADPPVRTTPSPDPDPFNDPKPPDIQW